MSGRDGGDAFLARWAARKTEALKRARRDGLRPEESADALRDVDQADLPIPEDLENLDPERLDPATTDFSRFLREDVPERLQRAALRKLWNSDDILANLDGLNDYDEDFTPAGMAAAAAEFFRRTAETLLEETPSPEHPDTKEGDLSSSVDTTDDHEGAGTSLPSTATRKKSSTDA